jgi:hypothetical protein
MRRGRIVVTEAGLRFCHVFEVATSTRRQSQSPTALIKLSKNENDFRRYQTANLAVNILATSKRLVKEEIADGGDESNNCICDGFGNYADCASECERPLSHSAKRGRDRRRSSVTLAPGSSPRPGSRIAKFFVEKTLHLLMKNRPAQPPQCRRNSSSGAGIRID